MSESTEGIICPHCEHLHVHDLEDAVTYWGEHENTSTTCDDCGCDFEFEETVVRTWTTKAIDSEVAS